MGTFSLERLAGALRAFPSQVARLLSSLVPIDRYEITNPAASAANGLKLAAATVAAPVVIPRSALVGAGITALAAYPRRITVTTAGTAADAPATMTVKGKGPDGVTKTEVVNVPQTATIASTVGFFSELDETAAITLPAADGTGATLAFGFGAEIGFKVEPELVNAVPAVVAEWTNGAPSGTRATYLTPANGAPYGGASFNTAPNATNDYAIWFERKVSWL